MADYPPIKFVTVGELQEFLAKVPDDEPVYLGGPCNCHVSYVPRLFSATYHRSNFPSDDTPPDGVKLEFM